MRKNLLSYIIIFLLLLTSYGCSQKKEEWQTYNFNSLMTLEYPGDWECKGDEESASCDNGSLLSSASAHFNVTLISSTYKVDKDIFASLPPIQVNGAGPIEEIQVDGAPALRRCDYAPALEMGICHVVAGKEETFLISYSAMPWKENQSFFDGMLSMVHFASTSDNRSENAEWLIYNFNSQVTFEYPNGWQCIGDGISSMTCSGTMSSNLVSTSFGVYAVSQTNHVDEDTFASLGQFPNEQVDEIQVDGSPAYRKCKVTAEVDEGLCVVLAGKLETFLFTYYSKPFNGNEAFLDTLLSRVHFESSEENLSSETALAEDQPGETATVVNQPTATETDENRPIETMYKGPPFSADLGIVKTDYYYNSLLEDESVLKLYGIPSRIECWGNKGTLVRVAELAELNWTDRILVYKITYADNNLISTAKFKIGSSRPLLEETFSERWFIEYSDISKFDIPGVITVYGYSYTTKKYDLLINQYSFVDNILGKIQYRDLQGKTIEIDVRYFLVVPEAP